MVTPSEHRVNGPATDFVDLPDAPHPTLHPSSDLSFDRAHLWQDGKPRHTRAEDSDNSEVVGSPAISGMALGLPKIDVYHSLRVLVSSCLTCGYCILHV